MSKEWITPVYDRNESDILEVKNNPQDELDLKGAFCCTDVNRTDNNARYIFDLLSAEGYHSSGITENSTPLTSDDKPTVSQINRLRQNLNNIITAWPPDREPFILSIYLKYDEVNAWEKLLTDIKTEVMVMKENYIRCGTINCGGDRLI